MSELTITQEDWEAEVAKTDAMAAAVTPVRGAPLFAANHESPSGLGTWMLDLTGARVYVLTADVAIATRRGFTAV